MSISSDAVWAASPTTTRGQPAQLSADPKGERIAYSSNKSIFLRSIDHPSLSTQYGAHTAQTTVARFSPSGFYVASGDVTGLVRVWDCEYHVISGSINDLAWDGDSQRIIAVGNGKQRFGHCFTADSGNSVGEISGHSASINSVSIRQQRPLRATTGSDDGTMVFYHGAPFKFNTSLRGQHNSFIYGVAFSPDGTSLVSVGADKKIWLYDGKSGEAKGQLGIGEHKGSIFGVSWASDSKSFVTCSGDQTVKVWDFEAGKAVQTWTMGDGTPAEIPQQQVGIVWPAGRNDGLIVSLALSGDLTYLAEGNQRPTRVIQGHQRSITAASTSYGDSDQGETLWTGSYDGRIRCWDVSTGSAGGIEGESPTTQIAGLTHSSGGKEHISSISWDDTLRCIDTSAKRFIGDVAKIAGQPKAIAGFSSRLAVVITPSAIQIYENGTKKVCDLPLKCTPLSVAASASGKEDATVAVGSDDQLVRIYTYRSGSSTLEPERELSGSTAAITSLAFSSNGKYLAAGSSSGKILVYDTSDYKVAIDRWTGHTARVLSIAWNQEGTYAASGGLDTNLFVWSVSAPGKRIKMVSAHKEGVNGVVWAADGRRVISVGADAAIKVWRVDGL
ncbi:MAG: WD40 repeat-like protein [Peltula sp. TS41687]|nr:MAG: WD40 repeat-like protein [Peltula sp. TS41687]